MVNYSDMSISDLIVASRERDDSAFSELVTRYTPMISKVISGFSDSAFRYDEAFSEACVALHRAVLSYDLSRSSVVTFGLYARICVYRRLCDLSDKGAREVDIVDLDVDLIPQGGNVEQRLVGRERMSEYLSKARGVLSEYEYEVFILYIDGYSTEEICERLGKDTKSVENAKSRMLKRLRKDCDIFSDV
jgi:RNA polymerase sporulation-specific sigma factor